MFTTPKLAPMVAELLSASADAPEMATLGWNLLHDERISPERARQAEEDLEKMTGRTDAQAKMTRLEEMSMERARAKNADFLNPSLNRGNFYDSGRSHGLHDTIPLVRMVNLGGLLFYLTKYWETALRSGGAPLGLLTAAANAGAGPASLLKRLDEELKEFNADRRAPVPTGARSAHFAADNLAEHQRRLRANPFLEKLFVWFNEQGKAAPFEPFWAAPWDDFRQAGWEAPERWSEIVGVHSAREVNWWLLLHYPANRAGRLVRPTQLDGGCYPWHFPTAASAATGYTMDRDGKRSPAPLVREYLHEHIPIEPEYLWACARVDGKHAEYVASGKPGAPQDRHLPLLLREVPALGWVRRPHP